MYSLSREAMLKVSKTTSLQNLFPSDCMTLYLKWYAWFRPSDIMVAAVTARTLNPKENTTMDIIDIEHLLHGAVK